MAGMMKKIGNQAKYLGRRVAVGGSLGAGIGAVGSTGAFVDSGMGAQAVKAVTNTLPSMGDAALQGGMTAATIAALAPLAVHGAKKMHGALSSRQQKGK